MCLPPTKPHGPNTDIVIIAASAAATDPAFATHPNLPTLLLHHLPSGIVCLFMVVCASRIGCIMNVNATVMGIW